MVHADSNYDEENSRSSIDFGGEEHKIYSGKEEDSKIKIFIQIFSQLQIFSLFSIFLLIFVIKY